MQYQVSFAMLAISMLLCSCGAVSAVPNAGIASEPTATMQPSLPSPALTQTQPPSASTDSVPQSADVWKQVRAQVPANVSVYNPTWLPERFGSPELIEAHVDPQYGALYTIIYPAQDENLAFILNMGNGALGNFPPPETREQVVVRGISGELLTSKEMNTMGIFWQETGQSYQIKAHSKQMTKAELLRIANSLVLIAE